MLKAELQPFRPGQAWRPARMIRGPDSQALNGLRPVPIKV